MKNWQVIQSQNRYFCNGRCLTSRHIGVFIFSLCLITIISALFFAFDCPYLTRRISPAVPAIGALLYLNVLCFILRTACTDPGILPRASVDEVFYFERTVHRKFSTLSPRILEVEMTSGHRIPLKFCQTCQIFRPPRVSHCSLCDACVANFDHHCPWVGNCVGLRNYRYFYLFLLSLSLLCLYILSFNVTNIVLRSQDAPTFVEAVRETPVTIVEGLICFFAIWSILGLWGYHTYLICQSITTNEDIKDTWNALTSPSSIRNPFSTGNSLLNCFSTLCGPLPPSFLNPRKILPLEFDPGRSKPSIISSSYQVEKRNDPISDYHDPRTNRLSGLGLTSAFFYSDQQHRLNHV